MPSPARLPAALRTRLAAAVSMLALCAPLRAAQQRLGMHRVVCTPASVQIDGGPAVPQKNPIAFALSQCGPGSSIRLERGEYPAFGIGFGHDKVWNGQTTGGTANQPLRIYSNGGARIVPGSGGDTISIANNTQVGYVTFENLEIVPGYRSAVIFFGGKNEHVYPGFRFLDCDILGTWNHHANTGGKSTWGVWAHGLADFEFRGVKKRVRVENIRKEHAFYLQNSQGDVLIENVEAKLLGRTFCQFTARPGDGPPGRGKITVRNCRVEDACIAATDNFKGGSALTFAGRMEGPILLEKNVVRLGFAPGVQRLTKPGVPYGTGALMVWDAGVAPNGPVILKDNTFSAAPGCGDRPLVSIGGCSEVQLQGKNVLESGGEQAALTLDPLPGGGPANTPNGPVYLARETAVAGRIEQRGRVLDAKARAELEKPLAERPAPAPEPAGRAEPAERGR